MIKMEILLSFLFTYCRKFGRHCDPVLMKSTMGSDHYHCYIIKNILGSSIITSVRIILRMGRGCRTRLNVYMPCSRKDVICVTVGVFDRLLRILVKPCVIKEKMMARNMLGHRWDTTLILRRMRTIPQKQRNL